MKKILVVFLVVMFVCVSIVSAKVRVTDDFKEVYYLGDEISGSLEITGESEGNVLLEVYLRCGSNMFTFYAMPIMLKDKEIRNIDLPAFPVYDDLLGKCRVVAELKSFGGGLLEDDESEGFEISNVLDANFSVDSREIEQGGLIEFSVNLAKQGEYGVSASFVKGDVKRDVADNFTDNVFSWVFSLPSQVARGRGSLSIAVNDMLGNAARETFEIVIMPVIANVSSEAVGDDLKPREKVVVMTDLFDYVGDRMEDNLSVMLKDSMGRVIENFWMSSGGAKEIFLPDHTPPGEYVFSVKKNDFVHESRFNVIEVRDIVVDVDDGFLVLDNQGNVLLSESIVLNVTSKKNVYSVPLELYVEPGNKQRFDLRENLPENEYDLILSVWNISYMLNEVYVSDARPLSKKISQGWGGLTGKAIIDTEDETSLFGLIIGIFLAGVLVFVVARSKLKLKFVGQIASMSNKHSVEVGSLKESIGEERKLKKEMKGLFDKYVGEDVREFSKHHKHGMEKRDIAVLFTDMRGFAKIFDELDEIEVTHILDMYFKASNEVIKRQGGFINKFVGDSVMALFNAPRKTEDYVMKAVKAGVQIREEIAKVNARLKNKGMSEIEVGIGIDFGSAAVGALGSREKTEYTAIGVPVNTAFRLQGEGEGSQVLISDRVYALLRDHLEVEDIGEMQLKNINRPIRVYNVLRIKD